MTTRERMNQSRERYRALRKRLSALNRSLNRKGLEYSHRAALKEMRSRTFSRLNRERAALKRLITQVEQELGVARLPARVGSSKARPGLGTHGIQAIDGAFIWA